MQSEYPPTWKYSNKGIYQNPRLIIPHLIVLPTGCFGILNAVITATMIILPADLDVEHNYQKPGIKQSKAYINKIMFLYKTKATFP